MYFVLKHNSLHKCLFFFVPMKGRSQFYALHCSNCWYVFRFGSVSLIIDSEQLTYLHSKGISLSSSCVNVIPKICTRITWARSIENSFLSELIHTKSYRHQTGKYLDICIVIEMFNPVRCLGIMHRSTIT